MNTITDIARSAVLPKNERRLQEGEVRPAAILFIDVVGFTEMAVKLAPEQLAKLIDGIFRIFELTARSCGGYLDKVIGDAALYVFAGHPNFAPPCESAVSASLKILDRTAQMAQSLSALDLSLAVRCGVAFGEVARQRVGGEDVQVTVMGDTVNLAQRLESTAVPGTILVDRAVLLKTGELFDHQPLGRRELKGFGSRPVYRITSRRQQQPLLRSSHAKLSPMVARERELDEALARIAAWTQITADKPAAESAPSTSARPGRNRLLVVSGVRAVGKSRFALELLNRLPRQLGRQPLAHATAHCSEHISLHAFTAECVRIAGISADNLVDRWEELCRLATTRIGAEYATRQRRHLPLLAHVLGCNRVSTAGIRQGGAAAFENGCQLAIRSCCELSGLAGYQCVLVVEDVQWLGNLQPILTEILALEQLERPLVVVATARPEFDISAENLQWLCSGADSPSMHAADRRTKRSSAAVDMDSVRYSIIELGPIEAADGRQLLSRLLPGVALPPEVETELHAKACGLPYYYEEFARMLIDNGTVVEVPVQEPLVTATTLTRQAAETEPTYQLGRSPIDLKMPDDIRMLLLGRLDLLTPNSKELATRASVLGRSFSFSLLCDVERLLGSPSGEVVQRGLAELENAGILAQLGDDNYMFDHVLTRDAAYDSLLGHNRRLIHSVVGEALTENLTHGTAEEWNILPQLISHLELAGHYSEAHDRCCELLIIQAQSGRLAVWDQWEQKARDLAAARCEFQPGPAADHALYLRALGIRQLMRGELAASSQHFSAALDLAQQTMDQPAIVKILSNIAMIAQREGEYARAVNVVRQAITVATEHGLDDLSGTLYANLGLYEYSLGNFQAARECYEQASQFHKRHRNLRGLATVQINLGGVLKHAGDFAGAQACFARALELSQLLGDRVLECGAQTNLGVILQEDGQYADARQLYLSALETNREINRLEGERLNLYNLGEVCFDMGRYDEATDHYQRALDLTTNQDRQSDLVLQHCGMGRALAALRRFNAALLHLGLAQELAQSASSALTDGICDSCMAFYYTIKGELDKAHEHLNFAKSYSANLADAAGSQLVGEIRRVELKLRELQLSREQAAPNL